jgi:hypothetical protein
MRLSLAAIVATAGFQLTIAAAPQAGATALCDALASRVRAAADVEAGARTVWSFVNSGREPFVEIASVNEVSLQRDPEADERVQFEKRIRALYGNAESVLKDLRAWDNFDIFALPGSEVRMLLTTSGDAQCESRYFFRATTSRDVVRVPDPPAKTPVDVADAVCENLGGWGYFARVSGAEAFVEYHTAIDQESLRIVPLTAVGWQPACTMVATFQTSATTGKRERLVSVTSAASK